LDYALEMKTLFIDVKGKKELNIKLPKGKVGLISSIQYLDQLKELNIKDSVYGGVVLGCNADNAVKIKDKVDFYFFLGEGRFHAMNAAVKTEKEVYIASGDKISHEDIEKYKKLVDYLKKAVGPDDYILLVTQHIYSGLTIQKLSVAISDAAQMMKGLVAGTLYTGHIVSP